MCVEEETPSRGTPRRRLSQRWFGPMGSGSLRSGLLVLTMSAMGAGTLTLPFAVRELGWALGSFVVVALALLNVASLELLLDAGMKQGATSYGELICMVRGPWTASLLDLAVSITTWGAITVYFIFIKQLLPPLLAEGLGVPQYLAKGEFVLPCVAVLVFCIALPRDITTIGKFSLMGIVSVFYVIGLLVASAFARGPGALLALPASALSRTDTTAFQLANASALVISGFLCQYNVFFVYSDVKEPTARRMRKITRLSTLFQTFCYLVLGLCGYAAFGEQTADDIYTNFPAGGAAASAGRSLMCASLCVSIPLCVFAARANLVGLLSRWLPAPPPGACSSGPNTPSAALAALTRSAESWDRIYTESIDQAEGEGVHIDNAIFSRTRSPPRSPRRTPSPPAKSASGGGGLAEPLVAGARDPEAYDGEHPNGMPEDVDAPGWLLHASATACIILATMALAFIVPSVSFLLGKVGGICGVTQMYIMPGLVLLKCKGLRSPAQRAVTLVGFACASFVGLAAIVL